MGKKFIDAAIKHPGALHKDLGVPEGRAIPDDKLQAALHSPNRKIRRRARFAVELAKMNKGNLSSKEDVAKGETRMKADAAH